MKNVLAAICVVVICGCANSWDEVVRVASPGGDVEGVVLESSGGATTSYSYRVHVVGKGKAVKEGDAAVARLYGAVRNDSAYGINLKWPSDSVLVIEYFKAQSIQAKQDSVSLGEKKIQVVLRDGVMDSSAPTGGMFYNLTHLKKK